MGPYLKPSVVYVGAYYNPKAENGLKNKSAGCEQCPNMTTHELYSLSSYAMSRVSVSLKEQNRV